MKKRTPLLASALAVLGVALLMQHFFVVNTTASFPHGLYLKTYITPQPGALVLFCPPDWPIFHEALERRFLAPGLCPTGTSLMIKRLHAQAGDRIHITPESVSVNDQVLPDSARAMGMHNAAGHVSRILYAGEVLLMSPHPLSFDGRYFGPLPESCLKTSLHPLYLWKE